MENWRKIVERGKARESAEFEQAQNAQLARKLAREQIEKDLVRKVAKPYLDMLGVASKLQWIRDNIWKQGEVRAIYDLSSSRSSGFYGSFGYALRYDYHKPVEETEEVEIPCQEYEMSQSYFKGTGKYFVTTRTEELSVVVENKYLPCLAINRLGHNDKIEIPRVFKDPIWRFFASKHDLESRLKYLLSLDIKERTTRNLLPHQLSEKARNDIRRLTSEGKMI